jgi:hypothetical protein
MLQQAALWPWVAGIVDMVAGVVNLSFVATELVVWRKLENVEVASCLAGRVGADILLLEQ